MNNSFMRAICLCGSLVLATFALAQAPSDIVTKSHSVTIDGKTYEYETMCGTLPQKNIRSEEVEGKIFFTYYKLKNGAKNRPLTFVWNGGPGSASLWLHLGFVGPYRVKMGDSSGMMPPPPYEYVPNNESILPFTDFVCVDPVGTGFSRPAKPEYGSKFWGVQEDINSVGEFIRTFLTNENKWLTPLFLLGESYGTTRAAGLSNWLTSHGVGVNGIVFVSTVLNFASQDTSPGNDIPYAFYLPSFTATAHYHKKLAADLQKRPVESVLDEVRKFIYDEYLPALAKGDSMSETEQKKIAAKLSHYTSIPAQFILDTKLRIRQNNFWKELLRDEKYTVGRLDARFKGMDRLWNGQGPDYDASNTAIAPPYTSCMNHYVRNDLGYKTDAPYYVLGEGIGRWNWGDQPVDTSAALRTAMVQNPFLKSLFACGYYDMATPFGSVEFTVNQMNLDARVRGNVSFTYYTAGHMMYLDDMNRKKLRDDVRKFMESSVKK